MLAVNRIRYGFVWYKNNTYTLLNYIEPADNLQLASVRLFEFRARFRSRARFNA